MKRLFAGYGPRLWSIFSSTACERAERILTLTATVFLATVTPPGDASAEARRMTLTEAIQLAQKNAYEVEAAYHDSLSAEHGLRAARGAWFPTFGVIGNAFGLHPQDPLGVGLFQIDPAWNEVYATNLRLDYPVYTGGRRINGIRRQRETLGAVSSELAAARLVNVYECRRAYIGLLVADRMLEAANASFKRITIIRVHVENLFAAGMADSVDILETELSLRGADRLVEEMRNQRRNASTKLARLLALTDDDPVVPTEFIPEPEPVRTERPAGPRDIARRPELAVADHQIAAARYQRSIVKANFLPVINGLGGYALVKQNIGKQEGKWQDLWWLGLMASWNLNLGGKEFSESSQALEAIRSLEMNRKDIEDSLLLQAQIAWNNIEGAYAVYAIRRDEHRIASRRFGLAEETQKAGQMTVNRLLELEAELTQTEQQFEAARLGYFAAVTDYLYAIGSDDIREGL